MAILVDAHCSYHCKLINSLQPDPCEYSVGKTVFSQHAVRSYASKGQVDKIEFKYKGPWEVVENLSGSSYKIHHKIKNTVDKRHTTHLSPYPLELILFEPIEGPDNQYGQLHQLISKDTYEIAGIKGFQLAQPFKSNLASANTQQNQFHFPTLAELNDKLFPWEKGEELSLTNDSYTNIMNSVETLPVMAIP